MGRYRAPQVDEDDDGQEVFPMDWDVIPDDVAEDHAVGSNFARIGRRDDDDDDDDDDGCYGSQTQRLVCTQRDEISHNILEQQKNCLLKAKRSAAIRRTITITAVTIFSVVLKRYAPPPPPILNLSPIDTSKLSTDHTIDTTTDYYAVRHLPDQSVHGNASGMGGVIQHETWARYSRHLLYLVYHAMVYVPSVAWYALSNSFRYAWDEMRDGYVVFWQRSDDARNENLFWTYPNMEKLISIITSIRSHVKHYVKLDEGDSHATTDIQNQKDIKVDELELPICMHAAPDNRKTWSARCGTAYRDDSSTSESAVGSWSTEDYLRQMIGTSLSPQNMALKIIAERLDTWGLLSVEEAQASASSGDSSSALPPAIGFLLVGPEGVGKMRTARRLEKYLLAGHCSDDTYLSRGVLEVLVAPGNVERAQSMTEMIVDHIHSRGGLGSVIIIHHIESMPVSFVTEISHVISGKYHSLSYQIPEILVEASCNGTVFVMTSRQWGTKSIFQTIQQNGGLNRLSRETIIQSIRREVDDAHLAHFSKLASVSVNFPLNILTFIQSLNDVIFL